MAFGFWRLAEYDEGSLLRYFVYGNYIDEVLVMSGGGGDYYYAHDHLYSTVALTNTLGQVVERYEYDAYGKAHILASDFSPLTSSQYGNPYLFTGRRLDVLDNGSLIKQHCRHRDYDTYMARFLQPDPLRYIDGMNLYEYVGSNSIMGRDPKGTEYTHEGCQQLFNERFNKYMKKLANCGSKSGSSFGKNTVTCLAGCSAIGIGTGAAGAKICLKACGGLSAGVNLAVLGACFDAAAIEKQGILQAKEYCDCRADCGKSKECHDQANRKYPDPKTPWWVPIFVW